MSKQTRTDLETRLGDSLPKRKLGLQRKYDTIAHDFLDVENEVTFEHPFDNVIDEDYQKLDNIIDEAVDRIETKHEYTKEEATNVLKTIGDTLNDMGFEYKKTDLVNTGLKTGQIDCVVYSTIYLAIAEVLNLPLKAVRGPGHVFVRWQFDDNNYFNWETTKAEEWTDEFYTSWLNIADVSIEKGVFLKSLSNEEIYSSAYTGKGIALKHLKRYEEAIESYEKSLELRPNDAAAYNNKGSALDHLGRGEEALERHEDAIGKYEGALENYRRALELNPNFFDAHENKGVALCYLERYEEAIESFDNALMLDPGSSQVHRNKRFALGQLREIKESNKKLIGE